MVQRRIPRPRDLAPLLRFKRWEPNAKKRRLAQALTIDDLRLIAKRRTPQAPFDYTDGAAEAELSLSRARRISGANLLIDGALTRAIQF